MRAVRVMAVVAGDSDLPSQLASLKRAIGAFYAATWADWYREIPGAKPATLVIERSDHTSLYRPERDALCLYVTDDQLGEERHGAQPPWPVWKVELVHEMLHEWEKKAQEGPSAAGEALWREHAGRFGPDHQASFFTAIVDKAPHLGLTPDEFMATL
jgi:hypothetical protein